MQWASVLLGTKPENQTKNKNHSEKKIIFFSKKFHPEQISYISLHFFIGINFFILQTIFFNSMDQPRGDIIKNILYSATLFTSFHIFYIFLLYSSSRRFSYCSRPYWRFFSFSSSGRFLFCSQAYWHLLSFSSSERFCYILQAFFESFSLFFDNILLTFLYKEKIFKKNIFYQLFLYAFKMCILWITQNHSKCFKYKT